jgi:hypothetical protein
MRGMPQAENRVPRGARKFTGTSVWILFVFVPLNALAAKALLARSVRRSTGLDSFRHFPRRLSTWPGS